MSNTDPYWFHKKWGLPTKSLEERIVVLERLVEELQEKVRCLGEENVETSNCLYELSNSIEAVDARIDILSVENWTNKDV
jgi:hypothetical protein